jgi:hypothetical protein
MAAQVGFQPASDARCMTAKSRSVTFLEYSDCANTCEPEATASGSPEQCGLDVGILHFMPISA